MSFWSDIEPYVQYWLRMDAARFDEPEALLRTGSRRAKRHLGDDPSSLDYPRGYEHQDDDHLNGGGQPWAQQDGPETPGAMGTLGISDTHGSRATRRKARDGRHMTSALQAKAIAESAAASESVEASVSQARRKAALTASAENKEEIEELKNRYIVGRRSGKDIAARDGSIIIHKGDIIDQQVIADCDAAGKLVELILHMIIEDFEP